MLLQNLNSNFDGIIFPPIEYFNEGEIYILFHNYKKIYRLNPKFKCKFIEFQMKIRLKNYYKLNDFINILFKEFEKIENIAIAIYFYDLKQNNILQITENLLAIVYEKLKERKFSHFILKLLYIIHEGEINTVDYKYFIFQENSDYLIKKKYDDYSYYKKISNKSNILKTLLVLKKKENLNINKLKIEQKPKSNSFINLKDKRLIDILPKFKIFKKILMNNNIKDKIDKFLKSKFLHKSSTNISNNHNRLSSNHFSENFSRISYKSNYNESYLTNNMKEFKIEKTTSKFLINLQNQLNYQKGYKEFYTELYKFS